MTSVATLRPDEPTADASAVLRVVDVHKTFRRGAPWHRRRIRVLRGASLAVGPGEFVGLVGELPQPAYGRPARVRGQCNRWAAARLS